MRKKRTQFSWIIFILSFALTVFSGSTTFASDAKSDTTTKIVGGFEAEPGAWPWVGALVTAGGDLYQTQFCGSALIGKKWVITAAHCVYGISPSSIEVVFGVHDLTADTGDRYAVKQIYVHPSYSEFTTDSDVALLELEESCDYEQVALVDETLEIEGMTSTIIGWGNLSSTVIDYPETLQQVSVPIVSNEECNEAYNQHPLYNNAITDTMVCAGYLEGGKDSCYGDSGGPLVVYDEDIWKLAGLVSWGNGCATPGYYGVYTRISAVLDFINATIGDDDDVTDLNEVYIPHITGGFSDWNDYLQVDNPTDQTAQFTITLYSNGSVTYTQTHEIAGLTKETITLKDLSSTAQSGKINFEESTLQFRLSTENLTGGGVSELLLPETLSSSLTFYFSDFLSSVFWKGIAMSNISESSATLTLTATGNGSTAGPVQVTINPFSSLSNLYSGWFPTMNTADIASISVTSTSSSICGVSISGTSDSSSIIMLPAVPAQ